MHKIAVLFVTVSMCSAGALLVNGNFEQPITTGWDQDNVGSNITIDRATSYDPDPNYEVQVYKGTGSGRARLYQVVDIMDMELADLDFSIYAKLYAYDNNADTLCWAAAAVVVSYCNSAGTVLGQTRIYNRTTPCPWFGSSTLHLIPVSDSLWHYYSFNIEAELANLPGVSPSNVKKIGVALYDTTAHTC